MNGSRERRTYKSAEDPFYLFGATVYMHIYIDQDLFYNSLITVLWGDVVYSRLVVVDEGHVEEEKINEQLWFQNPNSLATDRPNNTTTAAKKPKLMYQLDVLKFIMVK